MKDSGDAKKSAFLRPELFILSSQEWGCCRWTTFVVLWLIEPLAGWVPQRILSLGSSSGCVPFLPLVARVKSVITSEGSPWAWREKGTGQEVGVGCPTDTYLTPTAGFSHLPHFARPKLCPPFLLPG